MVEYRIKTAINNKTANTEYEVQGKGWLFWHTISYGHFSDTPYRWETLVEAKHYIHKRKSIDSFKSQVIATR